MINSERVRQKAASTKRRARASAKGLIVDSIERIGSSSIGESSLVASVRAQARRAGANDVLLACVDSMEFRDVRTRIATYRIMTKLASGDLTRIPYLIRKLGKDLTDAERWAMYGLAGAPVEGLSPTTDSETLTTVLGPTIRQELKTVGDSALLGLLIADERIDLEDPGFRDLLVARAEQALGYRLELESPSAGEPSTRMRAGLIALASTRIGPVDIFLAGETLLAAQRDAEYLADGTLEFGTTSPLVEVAAQLRARGAGVVRQNVDHLVVTHIETEVSANVFRFYLEDGRFAHGDETYTRWHTPFELATLSVGEDEFQVPAQVERYLDERFGNWRTPTLFFDDVFDAPNTTPKQTLESLLYLYRRGKFAFAKGSRYYADASAYRMRDTFGIDYSMHVPQSLHPKVLSTPFLPLRTEGRRVVVVVGSFERVTGTDIELLDSLIASDCYIVAAVCDEHSADVNDRLTRMKTLRAVDHVDLVASASDLDRLCTEVGASQLYLHPELEKSADDDFALGRRADSGIEVFRLDAASTAGRS